MKKALGEFYVDNNCDEKSCDNLYQEFIKTRDPKVIEALLKDNFPKDKMIIALGIEGRAGKEAIERARVIEKEYGHFFKHFIY